MVRLKTVYRRSADGSPARGRSPSRALVVIRHRAIAVMLLIASLGAAPVPAEEVVIPLDFAALIIDGVRTGDLDEDDDVDIFDVAAFADCVTGPGGIVSPGCAPADLDRDADADLIDFSVLQPLYNGGPLGSPRIADQGHSGCLPGSRDPYGPCEDDDVIETRVENRTLYITHRNATYNCCPDDIVISLTAAGHMLYFTEREMLTNPCRCVCCYDVYATVVDLSPGRYTVVFCWDDSGSQGTRCYTEKITIP